VKSKTLWGFSLKTKGLFALKCQKALANCAKCVYNNRALL
jgi:hypothetical protein